MFRGTKTLNHWFSTGAFIKLCSCLAAKGDLHLFIYHLRYKYIIPSVLIFIFKTTRLIYFFSDPNMKSFWFNEDEIHRRRNRLRWLRIYWSRRLDIDYRGVTRLSPTRSQRNGPTSDLTQRRMNSEVYPTLLRTPLNASPLTLLTAGPYLVYIDILVHAVIRSEMWKT